MIGQNLQWDPPSKQEWSDFLSMFKNAGSAAINTISKPIKAIGNSGFFTTEPTNIYANGLQANLENAYKMGNQELIDKYTNQASSFGLTYKDGALYKGDEKIDGNTIIGQTGGGFNWGHTLENTGNLLKAGLSGWDLYQNISTYNDRKQLLKATKENVQLKNQQLKADMENMAKERARLDTMRSNAVAQRAGSSTISGW